MGGNWLLRTIWVCLVLGIQTLQTVVAALNVSAPMYPGMTDVGYVHLDGI